MLSLDKVCVSVFVYKYERSMIVFVATEGFGVVNGGGVN